MPWIGLWLVLGCAGRIEDTSPAAANARKTSQDRQGAAGGDQGSGAKPRALPNDPAELAELPLKDVAASVLPSPETRMARLTHVQWQNSVRDLLRLPASEALPEPRPDPVSSGFDFTNNGATLEVDGLLHDDYQQAAEDLSARITLDAGLLDKILPSGSRAPSGGIEVFIRGFGLRAHRRPLAQADVDAYLALFADGPAFYPAQPAFEAGVRLLLEAFLQSPYFVYRWEPSSDVDGEAIPLDDYEVAARLSYTLWESMPDDGLFAAAQATELTTAAGVAAQVLRLLDNPRAEPVVSSFHAQLMNTQKFSRIAPSSQAFPEAPADLGDSAKQEFALFVREVAFTKQRGYRELLTSTETFVNADLAKIYGVSGTFGAAFVKVQLEKSQRKGFLTQIGFLAAHSTTTDPDPIKRGVFLGERISCLHIAAPNDASPPPMPMPGRTNRELIQSHTEAPGSVCAGCHTPLINPFGFPFENYDAIGAFRTTDNGFPVDASAAPLIGGTATPVKNALDLIDALADSPDAHACYASHWLEFMLGRAKTDRDTPLTGRIGTESAKADLSIKSLIQTISTSRAFLNRSTEEAP